jgi:EPS-associated MarR family transcriptional regulator
MNTETQYKLMRLLANNPHMSQREVARELEVSLGKVNYCIRALIARGWVKASNFKNSRNKAAYLYILTPSGLRGRASLAVEYLRKKVMEYEALQAEIERMRREAIVEGEP